MRYLLIVGLALFPSILPSQDTARARALYEEGRVAMRQRKFDDAVKAFERSVELNPQRSEYHLWLGHGYTRQLATANFIRKGIIGRRIGAEYTRAVELDSGSIPAAEARVDFFLEAPGIAGGGADKAAAEAERIRGLSAYHGGFAQAKIAEKAKNWQSAEREYRALVRAYPDSSRPVIALAVLLQNQSRYTEALAAIDERLAAAPNDTLALYQLGRTAALSGQALERGEQALHKFLALLGAGDTLSRANGHYRLGMIREKQGEPARARAAYDSALALYPGYADALAARKRLDK
jgi:tetratricopeptide (TPR) repeat protein